MLLPVHLCARPTLQGERSSHSEQLDGIGTVRKSGVYGLHGILYPWASLPAQQFQDPN